MTTSTAKNILELLTHDAPAPRVWSFLLTIFGDLAQHSEATITASAINRLANEIGLKPEATRVALHRLKKEGWVQSTRKGRTSDYKLTSWGLSQVRAASPRIYTKWPTRERAWLVLMGPAGSDTFASGQMDKSVETTLRLNNSTFICADPPVTPDALVQELTADIKLPNWISDKLCSPDDVARTQAFHSKVQGVAGHLQKETEPEIVPLYVALIRVLLVHEWRRLVLSWPNLPARLYPHAWPGPACQKSLREVLELLPAPDVSTLAK